MSRKKSVTLTRKRLVFALVLGLSLTSCEVVRTVTTTAETRKTESGDLVVQTKTIESYHGAKK